MMLLPLLSSHVNLDLPQLLDTPDEMNIVERLDVRLTIFGFPQIIYLHD